MTHGIPEDHVLDVRTLLHGVNNELSIAVLQLEMMLETGETQSRDSLEESLDACRKAAEGLKQVWNVLGPRSQR
jgi:hypothetical protein